MLNQGWDIQECLNGWHQKGGSLQLWSPLPHCPATHGKMGGGQPGGTWPGMGLGELQMCTPVFSLIPPVVICY